MLIHLNTENIKHAAHGMGGLMWINNSGLHKNQALPRLPIDSLKAAYFLRPPDRAKLGNMWNYAMRVEKFQHSRSVGLQID